MAIIFPPPREADLLAWALNADLIFKDEAAAYGVSVEQQAAFALLVTAFQALYNECNQPGTRTPTKIEQKKIAKKALVTEARKLIAIVQAFPGTTDDMRRDLDVTIRDYEPTPVPVPTSAPVVNVTSVEGRLFNLSLREAGSDNKSKPDGVGAAWLYTYVGEEMPAFEQMDFRGSATKADTQIVVPADVAVGSKVWISACWVNSNQKPGPVSLPIFSWTNHGAMQNNAA